MAGTPHTRSGPAINVDASKIILRQQVPERSDGWRSRGRAGQDAVESEKPEDCERLIVNTDDRHVSLVGSDSLEEPDDCTHPRAINQTQMGQIDEHFRGPVLSDPVDDRPQIQDRQSIELTPDRQHRRIILPVEIEVHVLPQVRLSIFPLGHHAKGADPPVRDPRSDPYTPIRGVIALVITATLLQQYRHGRTAAKNAAIPAHRVIGND